MHLLLLFQTTTTTTKTLLCLLYKTVLLFQSLTNFNPKIRPLLDGAESNKNRWTELESERQARQKEEEDEQQLVT